ncbi:MAG: murein biosynthesis integral membrane protein MurJ [Fimbriimonadaceae bacterium]|nr:murein biosynthesis integral membrane protein MurJ [Fimbriimonadaceae bacterium]
MSQAGPSLPNVAKAGAIMIAAQFLSRFLGLIRDAVASGEFGRGTLTDAYVLSFKIPDLLFFLIAGGALSSAFIPVFSEYLHTDREDDAWHVFSVMFTVMSVLLVVLIAAAWIYAYPLTYVVAAEATDSQRAVIADLSRIVLPAQYAFFIGGLMFGTLYARQIFTVPGLGPNVYNLGIIFGAIVISNFVTPSIAGMSWGALGGAFLGNIVIPFFVLRKIGVKYKPSFDLKHEGVRKVFRLMAPVVFGLSLPGVFSIIIQRFGTLYNSEGVNTALNYSNNLMQVPLGVFGQSLALAAFPALAQFFATSRMDAFSDQLAKTMRLAIYLSVPVAGLFLAMPEGIIKVLFEHGAWKAVDTADTAIGLRMFAIGIAAWCIQPIIMRAFFAVQKPLPPIILGTITTVVFIIGAWLVSASGGSYMWLALAGSIAAILLAIMLLFASRKIVPDLDIPGVTKTFGLAAIAALFAGGALYVAQMFLPQMIDGAHKVAAIAAVAILGLAYAWGYYFITKALKMPETTYIDNVVAKMNRKKTDS